MLRLFYTTLCIVTVSLLSSFRFSSCSPRQDSAPVAEKAAEDAGDGSSLWYVALAVPDVNKAIEEVGGNWLELEKLSEDTKGEDYYDGFIMRQINVLLVLKKATFNKFVKRAEIIYDNAFEKIAADSVSFDDTVCAMFMFGQMRVTPRSYKNSDQNPVMPLANYLELIGNYRDHESEVRMATQAAK